MNYQHWSTLAKAENKILGPTVALIGNPITFAEILNGHKVIRMKNVVQAVEFAYYVYKVLDINFPARSSDSWCVLSSIFGVDENVLNMSSDAIAMAGDIKRLISTENV